MDHYSLVIPVYNKEDYIARALDSVLQENDPALKEILVVDDNSSDSSMEIVKKYDDPRIRILRRQKNGAGGYAARNLGILSSETEWISFLDADDTWLPGARSNIINEVRNTPAVAFFSWGWVRVLPHEEQEDAYYGKFHTKGSHDISTADYLGSSVKGYFAVHTNCVLIKKCLLLDAGLFPEDERRGGDSDLWLRCLVREGKIRYLPFLGAKYFLSLPGAVTTSNSAIFDEHPVKKSVDKLLLNNPSHHLRTLLRKYSDYKVMDWMREQIRRKSVKFHSFRYLNNPLNLRALKLLLSFLLTKIKSRFS